MALVVDTNIWAKSAHEFVVVLLCRKVVSGDDDVDAVAFCENALRDFLALCLATVVWLDNDIGREDVELSEPVLECGWWDDDEMWAWVAGVNEVREEGDDLTRFACGR